MANTTWGQDDLIRIVPAASACSDVNGNPRAAWGVRAPGLVKHGGFQPVGGVELVKNGFFSYHQADSY